MSNESTVTVRFFGICMHVRGEHLDRDGRDRVDSATQHRVILVNASEDRIDQHERLRELKIQPHIAQLRIAAKQLAEPQPTEPDWFRRLPDSADVVVWPLEGVTLTIEDATGQTSSEIAPCIPRLHDYAKPEPPPLLGPNRRAAGEASETACFFDFPRVDVQGEATKDEASVGVISVAVPAAPRLKVTRFDGDSFLLPLVSGAEISVWNAPADVNEDYDPDFLLYFLSTEWVPRDADHPRKGPGWVPCGKRNPYKMAGPGCSNSVYP